jgi:hypothetical protein
VIDMAIEEMEAEIQETNDAIRKRRRRTPGLMLKPLWMLTVFACLARSRWKLSLRTIVPTGAT